VVAIHGVGLDALDRLAIVDRIEACGGVLDTGGADEEWALRVRFPSVVPTTPAAGVPG
jgi:hypothetical protein